MRLKDRVAVVTGAGGATGRAICLRFAEEGAHIVAADGGKERLEETAALLRGTGAPAEAVVADVTQRASVQRLFSQALRRFGTYDIVVNAAGRLSEASILDLTEEDWDSAMAANLKSVYLCTQEAARYWVAQKKRGKIVNMASAASEYGIARIPHYCASKGGVKMFTRAVAMDLARYKINVNAIGPGGTPDGLSPQGTPEEQLLAAEQAVPWGRLAQPRDLANVALFLASDESDYITGELLLVTGGVSSRYGPPPALEPEAAVAAAPRPARRPRAGLLARR